MLQQVIESRFGRTSTAQDVLAGVDLSGKLVVVTGGAGGIGAATALSLAAAGADVVIGARSQAKSAAQVSRSGTAAPGSKIYRYALDLMSLSSIDAFADAVLALGRPLDILLNNAGVIGPLRRNDLGIEAGLMTNFIAHAVLTSRLAPALVAAGSSRLVSLTSFGHHFASFDREDPNFERRQYSTWASYGQSKTACVLLAVKVSNALKTRGIDALAVHPGAIMTELGRDMTADDYDVAASHDFVPPETAFKSPEQGAATSVWAATDASLTGRGPLYLEDCGVAPLIDNPKTTYGVMRYALDPALADAAWATAEQLIGRQLPL